MSDEFDKAMSAANCALEAVGDATLAALPHAMEQTAIALRAATEEDAQIVAGLIEGAASVLTASAAVLIAAGE